MPSLQRRAAPHPQEIDDRPQSADPHQVRQRLRRFQPRSDSVHFFLRWVLPPKERVASSESIVSEVGGWEWASEERG